MLFKMLFTVPFVLGCLWLAPKMFVWGPFLIVFMGVVLSFMWTPHIAELVSSPLTGLFDGGHEPPDPKPFYSIAMTSSRMTLKACCCWRKFRRKTCRICPPRK